MSNEVGIIEPQALGAIDSERIMIIHVADAAAYAQAHVPGALLVEPRELVDGNPPATGRLPSRERLAALFSRLGYQKDRQMVLYDDEGGGWAGRMAWTLDIIGHPSWRYLDGGIVSWLESGLPVEAGIPPAPAPTEVTLTLDLRPVAEMADVLEAIEDVEQVIWDVRSAEEFAGEKSGSRRAGHIPSAVNIDWMLLKDPARQLRLTENLRELLAAQGITPDKEIITHCQTHHRSGLSYMVARLLGFPKVRAYDGSWAEWGNRDDTPVISGRR